MLPTHYQQHTVTNNGGRRVADRPGAAVIQYVEFGDDERCVRTAPFLIAGCPLTNDKFAEITGSGFLITLSDTRATVEFGGYVAVRVFGEPAGDFQNIDQMLRGLVPVHWLNTVHMPETYDYARAIGVTDRALMLAKQRIFSVVRIREVLLRWFKTQRVMANPIWGVRHSVVWREPGEVDFEMFGFVSVVSSAEKQIPSDDVVPLSSHVVEKPKVVAVPVIIDETEDDVDILSVDDSVTDGSADEVVGHSCAVVGVDVVEEEVEVLEDTDQTAVPADSVREETHGLAGINYGGFLLKDAGFEIAIRSHTVVSQLEIAGFVEDSQLKGYCWLKVLRPDVATRFCFDRGGDVPVMLDAEIYDTLLLMDSSCFRPSVTATVYGKRLHLTDVHGRYRMHGRVLLRSLALFDISGFGFCDVDCVLEAIHHAGRRDFWRGVRKRAVDSLAYRIASLGLVDIDGLVADEVVFRYFDGLLGSVPIRSWMKGKRSLRMMSKL